MPGTQKSLFEQLKRKRTLVGSPRKIHDLFFQMRFADDHACLVVVDAKGKEIEAHYRDFGGHIREILKIVELIREKSKFSIDWEGTENGIDLSENGFLLWHLGRADSFVDENFSPIRFVEEPAELVVSMEGDAQLECKLVLECLEDRIRDFRLIDETHVFWNGKIYTIPPLGDDFSLVPSFETMIFPSETDKYLSLLFSHCENIGIRYRDYEVVEGPVQPTRPSLVFEKVDGDNSLYLRVSSSLPGFDPDFFDNYELSRVAAVNELENAIVVSQVDPGDIFSTCRSVEKTLNRYKKELEDPDADFYRDDNLFIIEGALAEKMIRKDLPRLVDRYMVFGAEKLKSYRVKVVEPELNLNLNHGLDFLEGDIGLTIEGEVFSLFEALHQYRRNSYIALNDGTHALLDPDYVQKLERIFQKKRNKVAVSFFDLPLVEELIGRKTAEETFAKSREIFEGFNRLDTMEMPVPEIRAEFRPYQVEGYKWMRYLHEHSLGGCLADDMGLGKTLQAIALLSSIYPGEEIPSLVVIPKSLIFNWENEIKKFNPDLSCHIYYGNDRDLDRARKHHLIITTYGMVRSDIETLKEVPFYYLILDESQNIKNINSQVSRAVMLLQSENRLALSGTPIENNLGELYSLFRFLNPSMFGSLERFNRNYLFRIQQLNDKDAAGELKRKIYPFILRRLKKDVLKDLPDKIEQVLYVDMTTEQKKFYEQRRVFFYETVRDQIANEGLDKSRFFVLQAITELRQIASIPEAKSEGRIISPKREMLMENILDSVANGHKILLFANFLSILDYLAEDLVKESIDYEVMTGATRNREASVNRFQNEPGCSVFLMTLKTGGQGLNLTAADTVFIFDPWWNIAAETQAIDRSHRIGQDKTVFSYKLIAKGTIEEKILKLQEKKRVLFENIISNDSAPRKILDEDDIDFMLSEE